MNNQHNAPGEQGVETVPGDPGMIQDLLRAVIAMSDRLKHLEGVMFGQKQPQSPPVADKPGDRGATPQDISFPGFIKDEFRADLKKNPAQAMINLTADIANRQKGADSPGILPEKYAEEIIKLSRAMRKNKLLSDFEDARELIKEIEAVFEEIPEISARPDAYEIAYRLVRAKIGAEDEKISKIEDDSKKKNKEKEDQKVKDDSRSGAFVEGKKNSPPRKDRTELTARQKLICKKLGISEKTYLKYMKKR